MKSVSNPAALIVAVLFAVNLDAYLFTHRHVSVWACCVMLVMWLALRGLDNSPANNA